MSEYTPKIDPRYRPEFQRGGSSAPPGLRPEPVPPVVTVGLPPAAQSHSAAQSRTGAPPPPPPTAQGYAPAAPRASEAAEFAEAEPLVKPRARWFNPFIIVLWVISLGLIFVTVSIFQQLFEGQGAFMDAGFNNAMVLQVSYLVAPYGLVLGVAGIIGLLFWHAATWRRWQRR